MKELHLNHHSTVNISFKRDRMTAFSRHCHGKNATISRLLDITFCLLFLRTEAINPTVFLILSAWQADLILSMCMGQGRSVWCMSRMGPSCSPQGCVAVVKKHSWELETEAEIARENLGKL